MTRHWTPAELGLESVDLQAASLTEYESPVLDLRLYTNFRVQVPSTEVGGTAAGVHAVILRLCDSHGNLVRDVDLLTAIDNTATTDCLVQWGKDFAAAETGAGTLGSLLEYFRAGITFAKLVIKVVTQSTGGTSNVASARLFAS